MPRGSRRAPGLQRDSAGAGAAAESLRLRGLVLALCLTACFAAVAVRLMSLGLAGMYVATLAVTESAPTNFARPDIIDRNGRLLATDVEAPSLFADPAIVLDRDELVEKLATVLPDLDRRELRGALSDRSRRFVWVRRGLSPKIAQQIHNLGFPGLSFRNELRRTYPGGKLAGYVLGAVNIDNKGIAGIEKYIDDVIGVEAVHGAVITDRPPVRLSIDIGVQHALEDELDTAMRRFRPEGAAGLVLDVRTGEVIASASLPRIDPSDQQATANEALRDRISAGSYELGSVFKTMTVAMALDEGIAKPSTLFDVREPLVAGRFTIADKHSQGHPLSVEEIFTHSSNVGAGMIALAAGPDKYWKFLKRLQLLDPIKTELGPVSAPLVPAKFERAELITVSYGHGIAVAPLQFAAAAAAVVNGGQYITPTFLSFRRDAAEPSRVLGELASRELAHVFRRNVIDPQGTGNAADVPGYRVGGKTGTAEVPEGGRYREKAVISSFLAAFPMDEPEYLSFVMLFEPKATAETGGQRTASTNAAPVTARLIRRIAPQLGVVPINLDATQ